MSDGNAKFDLVVNGLKNKFPKTLGTSLLTRKSGTGLSIP